MRTIAGAAAIVIALPLLMSAPAFAEDSPAPVEPPAPSNSPVDVPPLVSTPEVVPPSTMPEGHFDPPSGPASSPAPMAPFTPPVSPQFSAEQMLAMTNFLNRQPPGTGYTMQLGPSGELYIQNNSGYAVDAAPTPWMLLDVSGTSTVIQPVYDIDIGAPVSAPTLHMQVPESSGVSFVATNMSPEAVHVLVSWEFDGRRTSRWKVLEAGQNWDSRLELPPGATKAGAGTLVTTSQPAGRLAINRFENDTVVVVAASEAPVVRPDAVSGAAISDAAR